MIFETSFLHVIDKHMLCKIFIKHWLFCSSFFILLIIIWYDILSNLSIDFNKS